MSLPEIFMRLWRHAFAVLVVLFIATGVAYSFKHATPSYQESATLVFLPPISGPRPNPFTSVGGALTEAAGGVATQVMSPQGQQQVRQAGGTAEVDVELLNSYNLEYPDFSSPYLTVTTTSQDFPAVHRTFAVVTKLLTDNFNAQEVKDNVAPNNRIEVYMSGDTGPLFVQGSSKRAFGGLIILTILAIFAVTSFLDRHPIRLLRLLRRRPSGSGLTRIRRPGLRRTDPAGPDYY